MTADLDRVKRDHLIVDELSRRGIRPSRSYGNQVVYRCPLPGHDDHDPSFTVYRDTNTFKCYGCDKSGSIIDLVALLEDRDPKDVIRELAGGGEGYSIPRDSTATLQHSLAKPPAGGGEGYSIPRNSTATLQHPPAKPPAGCTLEALAKRCRLPVEHLKSLGLTEMTYMGAPAVRIPYLDQNASEAAVQYRVALEKSKGGDRFKWRKGSKPTLYGWPTLPDAIGAGYVVIAEGPSDCWTLRYHGFVALGLPSATGWRNEYAEALAGVERVFVIVEPDDGGMTVREAFRSSPLAERVSLIYMTEDAADPNDLHKKDPHGFPAAFNRLLSEAVPLARELREETSAEAGEAWRQCEYLALEPRILDHFAGSLSARGVAGEERLCKILYLALASRFFSRPVSVAVKGPSSGGKSYVIEAVLDYFPVAAYYTLSAMSERALAYMSEPLVHRFLIIFEAAGMEGDIATYLIRSLLSEGCIKYVTVEKTSEGLKEKLIQREGPTGLIVTTTRANLHPENETRLLSLTVTDTPEQTRSVFRAIADEDEARAGDLETWRALQVWLDLNGEHQVTVPFSARLAELIPPVAVRLRRDFKMVLNLVRAHALLHQATRDRDEQGRIVATLEDYAAVRELVADLVADEVGATVAEATRAVVQAVQELCPAGETVGNKAVAEKLGIDTSSASRRLRVAAVKGYVRNLETKQGVTSKWVPGDPLPEHHELLPPPEALQCCSVAPVNEGVETPPSPHALEVIR